MTLSPALEKYILHWGEMGTRWGTNRTVAQIHALLYLSPQPLTADDIVEALSIARSNVSTSIRELQAFGLVRMTHVMGDRRDYFEAVSDVWEMFNTIMEQRWQREIAPTVTMLKSCVAELDDEHDVNGETKQRVHNMLEFLSDAADWYAEVRTIPEQRVKMLMRLGARVAELTRS
ncbi:MAG: GbsR/MarR family transcriptional regulator [Pseudomonadota bacterium]